MTRRPNTQAIERQYRRFLQGVLKDALVTARRLNADSAKYTAEIVRKIVSPIGKQLSGLHARSMRRSLEDRVPIVDLKKIGSEPWLAKKIEQFTDENVALIRSLPKEFLDDAKDRIKAANERGARASELSAELQEAFGVAESRADLIARDQVSKFTGELNRARQEGLGIERFVWRTLNDQRVRSEHAERDGVEYSWADPPDGETPGGPVNCRCYADPVL